jgi:transcription initiation factor TFIIB
MSKPIRLKSSDSSPLTAHIKTKKKKTKKGLSKSKKKQLWDTFDDEISKHDKSREKSKDDITGNSAGNGEENSSKDSIKLECVYRSCGERETCDLCGEAVRISEEGFLTCSNTKCGVLYSDSLDQSAEWRYYGAEDSHSSDPTRCGMPINPLLKESSYGCKVVCNNSSSYEMRKIRRYTEWQSMPYKEKSQYDEFQWITIMAHNAGIPKIIIDEALRYHKKLSEQKTFRGMNRDGFIAASIYIASMINNYPRTSKEIATIFHLDASSASKGCKNAVSIINNLENNMVNKDKTYFHNTRPIDFIERYCSRLNINAELTKLCVFISVLIEKNNVIPENTPHSIAAGIIYFISQICKLNISKHDVTVVSEISEVTINKCYKKLDLLKEKLVPQVILKKYSAVE